MYPVATKSIATSNDFSNISCWCKYTNMNGFIMRVTVVIYFYMDQTSTLIQNTCRWKSKEKNLQCMPPSFK